jgi:hypothetical protein
MLRFNTPVQFPDNWVRSSNGVINRQFASNINVSQAIRYLSDELNDLKVSNATLYSNFDNIDNDIKRQKRGHSEGASVKFSLSGSEIFIGCDKWAAINQNIYALSATLRNVNLIVESGTSNIIKLLNCFNQSEKRVNNAVHSNNKQNNNNSEAGEWLKLLGLGETATLSDANAVYRSRAKLLQHDEDLFLELNQAIEQARKYLRD